MCSPPGSGAPERSPVSDRAPPGLTDSWLGRLRQGPWFLAGKRPLEADLGVAPAHLENEQTDSHRIIQTGDMRTSSVFHQEERKNVLVFLCSSSICRQQNSCFFSSFPPSLTEYFHANQQHSWESRQISRQQEMPKARTQSPEQSQTLTQSPFTQPGESEKKTSFMSPGLAEDESWRAERSSQTQRQSAENRSALQTEARHKPSDCPEKRHDGKLAPQTERRAPNKGWNAARLLTENSSPTLSKGSIL